MKELSGSSLFLIAPQRTGTTVFRELLASSGKFYPFGEIFHPDKGEFYSFFSYLKKNPAAATLYLYPSKENKEALFDLFFKDSIAKCKKKYAFYDVKQNSLHHFNTAWHYPSQPPFMLELLLKHNVPIVRIRRRNLFKQALSTIVANKTGKWHIKEGEHLDLSDLSLKIPKKRMAQTLLSMKTDNEMIDQALKGYDRLLELEYEKMFVRNQFLDESIPSRLSQLMRDEELSYLPLKLPLSKSVRNEKSMIKNSDELIAFFQGTEFEWMLKEALGATQK